MVTSSAAVEIIITKLGRHGIATYMLHSSKNEREKEVESDFFFFFF